MGRRFTSTWALSEHGERVVAKRFFDFDTSPESRSLLWFQNRCSGGRLLFSTNLRDALDARNGITLPHHFAIEYRKRMKDAVSKSQAPTNSRLAGSTELAASSSSPSALPTEILRQILAYLVPTDRIFHFCPVSLGNNGERCISVHQICPVETEGHAIITISSIALTCWRFKDVVYSVFYGENQFVLEFSTANLTSRISVESNPYSDESPSDGISSWNRIQRVPPGLLNPIYPLSLTTGACVKDLTICIALSRNIVSKEEEERLLEYVSSIAKCFEEETTPSLRRLGLGVAVVERSCYRNISTQLQLIKDTSWRLQLNRQVQPVPGSKRKRSTQKFENIFSPFEKVRGDVDVHVGGLLDATFGHRLSNSMGESRPERTRPSDAYGELARKRSRF